MRRSEYDCARYGNEARWALASQIHQARNVRRAMLDRARETEATDWRLAGAYRAEANARLMTIEALRCVSRTLRGV